MEHFYKKIQGWFNFERVYSAVINFLPNNAHVVEIGAWKGMSTAYLAVEIINSGKNIQLDVIDTWAGSCSKDDIDRDMYLADVKENDGNIFPIFKKNMEPVINIINPIQMPSFEASKLYPDKSLDFVFIDGGHTYESAKQDILSWLPKIKSGGFMGGHDYKFKDLPGVTKAVDEVFKNVMTINGTVDENNPNAFIVPSFLVQI